MNRSDDWVSVPYLIGLDVRTAEATCSDVHLVVVGPDIDGPPLDALTSPGVWIVTAQRPAPGVLALRGDPVTIEFKGRGGEAGDREPRRPPPEGDLLQTTADDPNPFES